MVATLKIIKKLNQKILRTMQRTTSAENFYNFRNKECSIKTHSSYNFERSDQESKDGSVFDLKIREKLNQKIIKGVPPAGRRFSSTARRGKSNPTARALLACYRRDARNLNKSFKYSVRFGKIWKISLRRRLKWNSYNFLNKECSIKTHSSYNFEPQATTEIIPSYFLT